MVLGKGIFLFFLPNFIGVVLSMMQIVLIFSCKGIEKGIIKSKEIQV